MKSFPKLLIEAFNKASDNEWEDSKLYDAYRKEAEKYLGKSAPSIEFAKLVVPLARLKMGVTHD